MSKENVIIEHSLFDIRYSLLKISNIFRVKEGPLKDLLF